MPYTRLRSQAVLAAQVILGPDIYRALKAAPTPVPTILEMAGRNAFIENLQTPSAAILRLALKTLSASGELTDNE